MSIRVSDFILQVRSDLQEKSEHWSDEDLLIKLKRSYVAFQEDLPFFITDVTLGIQKGKREYFLSFLPLKDVLLDIDGIIYEYVGDEFLYVNGSNRSYSFINDVLVLKDEPTTDTQARLVYKSKREIETEKCFIEQPTKFHKALRYLFLMEIHDKPTRNTKERNLSAYYEKKYLSELYKLKIQNRVRRRNITSKYQRV